MRRLLHFHMTMRTTVTGIMLGSAVMVAQAWSEATPPAPVAIPASETSQTVTLAELEGAVVEATVIREQWARRNGQEFSGRFEADVKLIIGSGGKIDGTTTATYHSPRGVRKGETQTFSTTIGQVLETARGYRVWVFADGTLTLLRANARTGGFRRTITFSRAAEGLTCTASDAAVRETGAANIVVRSPFDGLPTTIIREKPISSTCRVTKKN
jgi:hypothetical protein